jgi:ferritin-like metal-binding protein YciE
MEGLIDESETIIDETDDGTATRDVGLIMAAQKVEHYEIATYGGLAQLARTLGYEDVAEMLETTLEEEEEADRLLTDIAENDINYQASGEIKVD